MKIYPDPILRKNITTTLLIAPPGKITITNEGSRERKMAVPPLGLAYLAAGLRNAGVHVEILDTLIEGFGQEQDTKNGIIYGLRPDQIKERILKINPDLVGVSCLFSNRGNESLNICTLAKETLPDIHVVLGGQHPSGMPELILNDSVDYILRGESDYSLIELVRKINNHSNLTEIDGIVLKQAGKIICNEKRIFPDVKTLPYPAWNLLDLSKYWDAGMSDYEINTKSQKKFMVMITSRGCPHNCYYCTSSLMSGRQYREREIEDILLEITLYTKTYGIEEIHFWDDNFFVHKAKVKKLLRSLIEQFPDISFQIPSGSEINALDEEVIELMALAGIKKVYLAVESANQDVQNKYIEKKVKLSRISDLIKQFHAHGIIVEGSFMVGFPNETKAQIDHTFDMVKHFGFDRISISIVNPLPGTPLFNQCRDKHLFYEDFDIQNIRWSNENIRIDGIERGYLAKMRRKVWLDYMQDKIDIQQYESEKVSSFK